MIIVIIIIKFNFFIYLFIFFQFKKTLFPLKNIQIYTCDKVQTV